MNLKGDIFCYSLNFKNKQVIAKNHLILSYKFTMYVDLKEFEKKAIASNCLMSKFYTRPSYDVTDLYKDPKLKKKCLYILSVNFNIKNNI